MKDSSNVSGLSKPKSIGKATDMRLLRSLREQKRMKQIELAERSKVSRRRVQHIEQKPLEELTIKEIYDFAQGLGCRFTDLVRLISVGEKENFVILKCSMDKPISIARFGEGVELVSLMERNSNDFIGILNLDVSRKLDCKQLPLGDMLFGVVLKGKLLIDSMGMEKIFEEKSCFRIPGCIPFELHNTGFAHHLSILLHFAIFSDF